MSEIEEIVDIEENSDSSNSEIEINDKPKKHRKVRCDKIIKEKKPYILTDARKENIEKARAAKTLKVEQRKKEEEERNKKFLEEKKKLENKKFIKLKKQQDKQILKLKNDIIDVESDSDEEIIVMKKPRKKYVEKIVEKIVEKPVVIPVKRINYF